MRTRQQNEAAKALTEAFLAASGKEGQALALAQSRAHLWREHE